MRCPELLVGEREKCLELLRTVILRIGNRMAKFFETFLEIKKKLDPTPFYVLSTLTIDQALDSSANSWD